MSNKKQTAVDKLHSRILFNIGLDDNDIKELGRLASECMNYEKERIIDAYNQGYRDGENDASNIPLSIGDIEEYSNAEQYYKETYEASN